MGRFLLDWDNRCSNFSGKIVSLVKYIGMKVDELY